MALAAGGAKIGGMEPDQARILLATRFAIPQSWVRVLSLAWTAVAILMVVRWSRRRVSVIKFTAQVREGAQHGVRGRAVAQHTTSRYLPQLDASCSPWLRDKLHGWTRKLGALGRHDYGLWQ